MITPKENLKNLLPILANLTGYAGSATQAKAKNADGYLCIEHLPEYGGYRLVYKYVDGSGTSPAFGFSENEQLVKARVMERQLQGLIKGIAWERDRTRFNIEVFSVLCANKQIDAFEVHPVRAVDESYEQCEPKDADFWSVYVHYPNEGLRCIADCTTEKAATDLATLIQTCCINFSDHLLK